MKEQFLDRIPPQAVELEKAILGAIMLEPKAYDEISDFIHADVFYKPAHVTIYKAIVELHSKGEPADILTVVEILKQQGELDSVGGAFNISQLTNNIASSANVNYHSRLIYERFMQRELIRVSSELIKTAYDDSSDIFNTLSGAQDQLTALTRFKSVDLRHITETASDVFKLINRNASSETTLTGVPTGFTKYDKFSGGLQNGDLIIVGGETSNGKTSLALCIAANAALAGYCTGIWSYEMTDVQITARLMAQASKVSAKHILMQPLNAVEIENVNTRTKELFDTNIYIDDCSTTAFSDLLSSLRIAKQKYGIQLAVVDYLQLITNELRGKSTEEQVADIANKLKSLAKTLDIPIILISQLRRDNDNPMPSRGRLKRSGDIENAADVIALIWLPEMYGETDITMGSTGESFPTQKLGHCIIAKGRNIGMTDFPLLWDKELTLFGDYIEAEAQKDDFERQDVPF